MRVVINQNIDGTFEVITDETCDVFVVCDYCPEDRVYKLGACHTVGSELVDDQLRDSDIGSATDERHAAIENRILLGFAGQKHLKPV